MVYISLAGLDGEFPHVQWGRTSFFANCLGTRRIVIQITRIVGPGNRTSDIGLVLNHCLENGRKIRQRIDTGQTDSDIWRRLMIPRI